MAFKVPGPCTITYNAVSFSTTKDGVIIRPRVNWKELVADVTGIAPSGFLETGRGCTVECQLCNLVGTISSLAANFVDGLGSKDASSNGNIGSLMSALASALIITEASADTWNATFALLMDPSEIPLTATSEMVIPATFIIIPDGSGDLFTSVPAYIEDGA